MLDFKTRTQRSVLKYNWIVAGVCLLTSSLNFPASGWSQQPEELQPTSQPVELFNGNDLAGWLFFCEDDQLSAADVWSVDAGVLKCEGRPQGYLQTKRWYRDYELELEWRWPGEQGGNSGVLVHASTPLLFFGWPKSLEVQLQSGAAGDFWVIGKDVDLRVENEADRRPQPVAGDQHSHRRITRLTSDAAVTCEKPIGQWNKMKVVCQGDSLEVFVNGVLVNRGTQCTVDRGGIALQSEGTPIEFRQIVLKPIVAASTSK